MSANSQWLDMLKVMNFNTDNEILLKGEFLNRETYDDKKTMDVYLNFSKVMPASVIYPCIKELYYFIVKTYSFTSNYFITYTDPVIPTEYLEEYYKHAIEMLTKNKKDIQILTNYKYSIKEQTITLYVGGIEEERIVTELLKHVEIYINSVGIHPIIKAAIGDNVESLCEERDKAFSTLDGQNTAKKNEEYFSRLANASANDVEGEYTSYKRNSTIPLEIEQIPFTSLEVTEFNQINGTSNIAIKGVLINGDYKEGRSKKNGKEYCLYSGYITNYKDSIMIKKFLSMNEKDQFKEAMVPGKQLGIIGKMEWDDFNRAVVVVATKIQVLGLDVSRDRYDGSEEKRVELHAHTKMTVLDSILNVEEYVNQASRFGHKALAVTDYENCHVLPTFFKLAKKNGLKPIAGLETNYVDMDKLKIALSNEDIDLNKATYTIFDFETTGLSQNFDEIIEIGAVKVAGGMIIDTFSEFIHPSKAVPQKVQELTNISSSDLYDAPNIEHVLPRFKEFIEGTVLVGHNVVFDCGFLYKALKKYNLYEHDYPTIDTIQIAKALYRPQGLKFANLSSCAKFLHCDIEQQHRAIHDSRTTNNVFQRMLGDLQNLGITNYKDLNSIINDKTYRYDDHPSHINILVRNRKGLKNFFKLVSDTQTTHYYKLARLVPEVLQLYREGLLIGSGGYDGDVFEAAYRSSVEELKRVMAKYDYIEVQPVECYTHLIEEQDDPNAINDLYDTVKLIIKTAKEMNKLVVATGDVHELLKEDEECRKIYLSVNRPNGGGAHALNNYKDPLDCHYRSTTEMIDAFSFLNDDALVHDIVIKNSNIINDMIEDYELFPSELFIPRDDFFAKIGVPSMKEEIIRIANETVHEMYGEVLPKYVEDRKEKELEAIISHGYFSVYYISHLLVKNSNDHGYMVGSRGSVGSSFAATLLKITEVNALNPHYLCPNCHFSAFKFKDEEKSLYPQPDVPKYILDNLESVNNGFDLPECNCPKCNTPMKRQGMMIAFETFLGFTGEKVPDIDLNFSGEYQPTAHLFVQEMFGKEYAFRAGTVTGAADKTAFAYARDYYSDRHIEKRQAELERLGKMLEGSKKTTGQHPGGIVVVPDNIDIYEVTPVQYPPIKDWDEIDNQPWRTTHFDYHSFEDNLLKLDILGHDDPTLLKRLIDIVHERPEEFPFNNVDDMPIIDEKIVSLFHSKEALNIQGDDMDSLSSGTLGIPEFNTDFVRGMLETIKPRTYHDIIKTSGLSHGEMVWNGSQEDLVTGANEQFPKVPFEGIIGCRDDIMVYLMKQGVEAAIAFKIMETVRKGKPLSDEFKKVMIEHHVPDWYIWACGKIHYLFPKAHAAAYVINACRICWFKIYRPIYYYAAYFSIRAKNYDAETFALGRNAIRNKIQELRGKVAKRESISADEDSLLKELPLALEMVLRGYSFNQIDLNKSDAVNFVVSDDHKSIYLPFVAIPALGEAVGNSIVEARKVHEFISKKDFLARTNVNKTQFARLSALGVFDDLPDDDPNTLF